MERCCSRGIGRNLELSASCHEAGTSQHIPKISLGVIRAICIKPIFGVALATRCDFPQLSEERDLCISSTSSGYIRGTGANFLSCLMKTTDVNSRKTRKNVPK